MPELQPFSRAEYLSALQRQISECAPSRKFRIPTEFELWILEWPEYAVIGSTLPGLEDDGNNMLHCLDAGERMSWSSETEAGRVVCGVLWVYNLLHAVLGLR